ncbi:hypothetical protein B7486_45225 [cyanobacterium TDX16]|nr:hypothetical protein B7486_45225 [cyanobacterium TDX16]
MGSLGSIRAGSRPSSVIAEEQKKQRGRGSDRALGEKILPCVLPHFPHFPHTPHPTPHTPHPIYY